MIIKDGGSSVDIRRRLAKTKTKTSTSTLSNIWKDRNIAWATKIRTCHKGVGIPNCELPEKMYFSQQGSQISHYFLCISLSQKSKFPSKWINFPAMTLPKCPFFPTIIWVTGCRKGRQESNISIWDVVLEKAAWDIIERSHHQWTHTSLIGKYPSLTTKIGQLNLKYVGHVCRRTHTTKWLSYTLLYKMASKSSKISRLWSDWFFQLLNFFKDHNIGETVRRKKEVGQGWDFSLACRLKRQGLDAKWRSPEKFHCF